MRMPRLPVYSLQDWWNEKDVSWDGGFLNSNWSWWSNCFGVLLGSGGLALGGWVHSPFGSSSADTMHHHHHWLMQEIQEYLVIRDSPIQSPSSINVPCSRYRFFERIYCWRGAGKIIKRTSCKSRQQTTHWSWKIIFYPFLYVLHKWSLDQRLILTSSFEYGIHILGKNLNLVVGSIQRHQHQVSHFEIELKRKSHCKRFLNLNIPLA